MTRGLYITVAVFGLLLVALAAGAALTSIAPPGYDRLMDGIEFGATAAGLVLAWAGLVQARAASEYDPRVSVRARRRADAAAGVAVPEVSFDCPECGRTYKAAGQVAGRPFACRVCDARFTVPRSA